MNPMNFFDEQFEEDYRELLLTYNSDDTKKNRRNLIFTSFIVLSIEFMDLSFRDLKLFGLNLSSGGEEKIIIIAIILIVFWLIMFLLHAYKDHEIFIERRHKLERKINSYYVELIQIKSEYDVMSESDKTPNTLPVDQHVLSNRLSAYQAIKNYGKIYDSIQIRLKDAKKSQQIIDYVNLGIPTLLGSISLGMLLGDLYIALN